MRLSSKNSESLELDQDEFITCPEIKDKDTKGPLKVRKWKRGTISWISSQGRPLEEIQCSVQGSGLFLEEIS